MTTDTHTSPTHEADPTATTLATDLGHLQLTEADGCNVRQRPLTQHWSQAYRQYKAIEGLVDTAAAAIGPRTPATTEKLLASVGHAVGLLETFWDRCREAHLFSRNEGQEDLQTRCLWYLLAPYFLADLCQTRAAHVPQPPASHAPRPDAEDGRASGRAGGATAAGDAHGAERSVAQERVRWLAQSDRYLHTFLTLLDEYDLLDAPLRDAYRQHVGGDGSEDAGRGAGTAADRRQQKIALYRAQKQWQTLLDTMPTRCLDDEEGETAGTEEQRDEEVVREHAMAMLRLTGHKALAMLSTNAMEATLLRSHLEQKSTDQDGDGHTTKGLTFDAGRGGLSLPPAHRPVTEIMGRKPFVLVSDRERLRKGVFGPGYNLPTMTVDEYLDGEAKRGNILRGGGNVPAEKEAIDDLDFDALDAETMRQRVFDAFKDDNPRGSGNRYNRS